MCAAKAVHAARAAADAMAKEAEILGELEASEDEEVQKTPFWSHFFKI